MPPSKTTPLNAAAIRSGYFLFDPEAGSPVHADRTVAADFSQAAIFATPQDALAAAGSTRLDLRPAVLAAYPGAAPGDIAAPAGERVLFAARQPATGFWIATIRKPDTALASFDQALLFETPEEVPAGTEPVPVLALALPVLGPALVETGETAMET